MRWRRWVETTLACGIAFAAAAPASASTFGRVDLDYLVEENETIVVAEAVSARSYWNEASTFILTDVDLTVSQVLKGRVDHAEITVTVPGGTVGELTSVVVGGAELQAGRWYVLFLDRVDLLGTKGVLAVHDHGQGAFDVEMKGGELRAFSQARRHELLPDAAGKAEAVGGAQGMTLGELVADVRERAGGGRHDRPEVK
jgi:hypothetical protein